MLVSENQKMKNQGTKTKADKHGIGLSLLIWWFRITMFNKWVAGFPLLIPGIAAVIAAFCVPFTRAGTTFMVCLLILMYLSIGAMSNKMKRALEILTEELRKG